MQLVAINYKKHQCLRRRHNRHRIPRLCRCHRRLRHRRSCRCNHCRQRINQLHQPDHPLAIIVSWPTVWTMLLKFVPISARLVHFSVSWNPPDIIEVILDCPSISPAMLIVVLSRPKP